MSKKKPSLPRLSRFLSLMLRHKAKHFGLELDSDGFTPLDTVWEQVEKRYPGEYSEADLHQVVAGDQHGKKRYEIRDGLIRALYGHGKVTPVSYPPAEPPEILYHGTTTVALAAIKKGGLKVMGRQYVHLGTNIQNATRVATRHKGQPIMLHIRAKEAYNAGVEFYNPEPEHFLTREIPPAFIDFPDDES
jgi:putative RNA 2'-phosphotransferase